MSEAEKSVRRKVQQKAQYMQKRKTTETADRKTSHMSDKTATSKGGPAKVPFFLFFRKFYTNEMLYLARNGHF